jgi:hypothetical protein
MAAKAPSATITHEDIQHLCGEHAASEALRGSEDRDDVG